MATCSSILAWETHGPRSLAGSMGSQLKRLSTQGEWSCDWQGLPQAHLSLNEIIEAQSISDSGPGLDNSQRIWAFAHGL